MDPGKGSFSIHGEYAEDGIAVPVPLHRVRTVYKDGAVIWQRPGHPSGD
jgi:hypothetical protein